MKKFSYQLCKDKFFVFLDRAALVLGNRRGGLDLEGTALGVRLDEAAEVIIGGTTYLVSSFFKPDAKSNVVDKVRRLIEREAAVSQEKQA